jgi:hypothetical protein
MPAFRTARHYWSPDEDRVLVSLLKDTDLSIWAIATKLQRSEDAIRARAAKLGLASKMVGRQSRPGGEV